MWISIPTYLNDDRRFSIFGNVPEHDVNDHCTQQQAHTAGDSLHPGEGAVAWRIHNRHPNVLVSEASGCPSVE